MYMTAKCRYSKHYSCLKSLIFEVILINVIKLSKTVLFIRMIVLRVQTGRWVYLLIDIYLNSIPTFIVVFSFISYIIPTIFLVTCLRLNNFVWGKFINRMIQQLYLLTRFFFWFSRFQNKSIWFTEQFSST